MSESYIRIKGGAWISGNRYGMWHSNLSLTLSNEYPQFEKLEEMCAPLPMRYGRFNDFTKLGFLTIALALRDCGVTKPLERPCGVIYSTRFEAQSTDSEYYRTTLEKGGLYSSANLFPYTLPVTVAGEAASFFHLQGPTFSVTDGQVIGQKALQCAALQLADDPETDLLAGWLDLPNSAEPERVAGAVFVMLETSAEPHLSVDLKRLCLVSIESQESIHSLLQLWQLQ